MNAKFRWHYIFIWSLEATPCAKSVKRRLEKSQIYEFDKRDHIRRNKHLEFISVLQSNTVTVESNKMYTYVVLCCCVG